MNATQLPGNSKRQDGCPSDVASRYARECSGAQVGELSGQQPPTVSCQCLAVVADPHQGPMMLVGVAARQDAMVAVVVPMECASSWLWSCECAAS